MAASKTEDTPSAGYVPSDRKPLTPKFTLVVFVISTDKLVVKL